MDDWWISDFFDKIKVCYIEIVIKGICGKIDLIL